MDQTGTKKYTAYIKKFIETPSCTKNKLARMVKMADFEVFN